MSTLSNALRAARENVESWAVRVEPLPNVVTAPALPGGAVRVKRRKVEKRAWSDKGMMSLAMGVPKLARLSQFSGEIEQDYAFDELDWDGRLPFRFPWYSRSIGVELSHEKWGCVRWINRTDVNSGMLIAMTYGEERHWETALGRVRALRTDGFVLEPWRMNEEHEPAPVPVKFTELHRVGKVMCVYDAN